jgi:hypothetical protein
MAVSLQATPDEQPYRGNNVTQQLKAGIVEWIDEAIPRQWQGKHVATAADTEAATEDSVFCVVHAKVMRTNWQARQSGKSEIGVSS